MSLVKTHYGTSKPKQKVSKAKKTKDWAIATAKYYKDACKPAIEKPEALKLYRLANGQLDEADYLHVTNPINTTRWELMGYPAKLVNYDIISPNVMLVMGEKARRFFPPMVVAKNSRLHSEMMEKERLAVIAHAQKMFINELIKNGLQFDEEVLQGKLEDISNQFKNLPDKLASDAQHVLEYLMDYNDLPRNLRKGFYDFIVTAMVYSYKDVLHGKTKYEIISSMHLSYLCGPQHDFIEDGDAVKVDYILSINDLYDRFQDDPNFSEELEEFIDQNTGEVSAGTGNRYTSASSDIMNPQGEMWRNLFGHLPEEEFSDGVRVEHVMWRTFAQEGKLTRRDMFGGVMIDYVDEDFIPVEGDNIEWKWVDQIYEAYCVGERYWVGIRPVPIQRGSYDDPHSAKLLYNGRNFFARHTRPTSLVKRGESYQKSVNIVKYRAEETMLKNLDKIVLFPLGLVPKKEGWDEAKMMYYLRAFNFLFFDDTRPNAGQMVSALKDLDMSSTKYLLQTYQIVQSIKQEWDESCGLNPQRKAQVGASAGKGVTEAAIDRSYVMSEEMYLEFEEFEKREFTGMLELGKYAFVDGIQSWYIKPDGTKAFLDLHDPDTFINSDLAVFIKNGARELQKLELLRQQVQAFAQNGATPKEVAATIEADNFAQLHQIMDEIEVKMDARRQQEQAIQQEVTASKERIADKELEFKYYDKDLRSYTDIQVALIDEGMQIADDMRKMEANGQATVDKEAFGALRTDLEKNTIELMKNATKLKEIASKERMNTENNKTALKNKASGEK